MAQICNVFLILCLLILVFFKGDIQLGVAGLIFAYAYPLPEAIIDAVQKIAESETSMVGLERCLHFTQLKSEDQIFLKKHYNPQQLQISQGNLIFSNVQLRYRPNLPTVLSNVSFIIEPKQKIGIAGRTGSGKSSICLALFRIIEIEQGEILIDGQNIQEIPLDSLRKQLSIIPQEPVIFQGSLRMNLDPFNEYQDERIIQILEQINLLEKFSSKQVNEVSKHQSENESISRQNLLLLKQIQEQGSNISIGERQLICIGRALLSKILIMDEATAAIDLKTDEMIQNLIKEKFKEQTVITVAHRIHTIKDYDKILLLKQGKVIQFDKPEYVIEKLNEESLKE